MTNLLPPFQEELYKEYPFYVKYFGYEIEGGFEDDFSDTYCEECDSSGCGCVESGNQYFKHDGSVETEDYTAGEIASPKFRVDRMPQFEQFVKENMPQEVNNTCGLHVHLSFNNQLAYEKTMDLEFFTEFKVKVKEFVLNSGLFTEHTQEEFVKRFRGNNTYCRDIFSPNSQATGKNVYDETTEQGRYTFINYPYNQHGTIECRLFPSTVSSSEVCSFVKWFIDFTNTYLKNQPKYERGNYQNTKIKNVQSINEKESVIICV